MRRSSFRAAAGMERRTPGFLERALAADARGRQTLAGLAAAVVASSAAAPFLRGFEPGSGGHSPEGGTSRTAPISSRARRPRRDHDDLDDED
jgi:hypothetical protein